MAKRCSICNYKIEDEFGKLKGTMIKVKSVKGKNELIHVCSDCQKQDGWIEKAKIKGA